MSGSEGEEVVESDSETESVSGSAYMYVIPLEEDKDGVSYPAYDPSVKGGLYLYHYDPSYLYIIQGTAAGHFHRDDVSVMVEELPLDEVEASNNLIDEFVR